ncbi:MAG: nucleotidyltransferase [Methanomassiliicoccales archaeon]
MATTISQGFTEFLQQLTPSNTEITRTSSHRQSILDCLKDNASITRIFQSGSYGSGTSIHNHSDVDYFVCNSMTITNSNSDYVLRRFREILSNRFQTTDVNVRTPGVSIQFAGGMEPNEIIPAYDCRDIAGYQTYWIADGKGGWMETCPEMHGDYVNDVDKRLKNKVKPLIRYLKAWKYYQNVPINSFYLEMKAAQYADGETEIDYIADMHNILQSLKKVNLASMQDPTSLGGYIYSCPTDVMKCDALSRIETALVRIKNVYDEKQAGKIEYAFNWLNKLFNSQFPSFG